ncbi:MAG: hypothetical protein M1831_000166 [Alyxoria varia]|nr:MAG: hypothetical protein M1831_000166 [Alyxoria varia]
MPTRKRGDGATNAIMTTEDISESTNHLMDDSNMTLKSSSFFSPFLPTTHELILLSLYPLILLIGSLYANLSPTLRNAPYSHTLQSYQPASAAPSYFATKRNVLNVYFVKVGWLWCSVALAVFTLLAARGRAAIDIGIAPLVLPAEHDGEQKRGRNKKQDGDSDEDDARTKHPIGSVRLHDMSPNRRSFESDLRLRRRYQVAIRWILCTTAWYITTQAFIGASLVDRLYTITGGACAQHLTPAAETSWWKFKKGKEGPALPQYIKGVASNVACKRAGGVWAGGLDMSGHVFLLMLGSGMLAFEMLPVVMPWWRGLTSDRVVRSSSSSQEQQDSQSQQLADTTTTTTRLSNTRETPPSSSLLHTTSATAYSRSMDPDSPSVTLKPYGVAVAMVVVILSWWMLLMTAAFFHTWVEKVLACGWAGAVLYAVYVVPRGVEGLRGVVGLPGV